MLPLVITFLRNGYAIQLIMVIRRALPREMQSGEPPLDACKPFPHNSYKDWQTMTVDCFWVRYLSSIVPKMRLDFPKEKDCRLSCSWRRGARGSGDVMLWLDTTDTVARLLAAGFI